MSTISQKHLLGIAGLTAEDIETILGLAGDYAAKIKDDPGFGSARLKGARVLSLFFEDSTRTRTSFEMAARRLGAMWININLDSSSVKKGESLYDTVTTLREIVKPSAVVIRHSEKGAPEDVAGMVDCPVINGGDNAHEHPTQALLDALTMMQHKGRLAGLRVAICGDIAHSRVANSNILLLTKMGVNVHVVAPKALMPAKLSAGVSAFENMDEGVADCDVVMMLRVQKERMATSAVPDGDAFFRDYGLTAERLARAKEDAIVMHPGPMNRGVEIDGVIADGTQSVILEQVANGVAVRMAVMELLLAE